MELIDLDAEYKPGDLCWLETPVNPLGEARLVACVIGYICLGFIKAGLFHGTRDIKYYADKVCKHFHVLSVFVLKEYDYVDPQSWWKNTR